MLKPSDPKSIALINFIVNRPINPVNVSRGLSRDSLDSLYGLGLQRNCCGLTVTGLIAGGIPTLRAPSVWFFTIDSKLQGSCSPN